MKPVHTAKCDAPLSTFLPAAPKGTDEHDCWVKVIALDENGTKLRPQEGILLDDRTSFTLPFRGSGSLPKTLTVYVYSMWEGIDDPDLATLDGIVLTVAP